MKTQESADEPQDVHSIHAPLLRELPDPEDGFEPMPIWLATAFIALLMWSFWYFGHYDARFSRDAYTLEPQAGVMTADASPKRDVATLGKEVFALCAACHQQGGEGVAGTFPPLAGSERVLGEATPLIHLLLGGLHGEIEVKGVRYKGVMPAWAEQLSDEEIAAVLTYIRSSFGNSAPGIAPTSVAAARGAVAQRTTAYTDAELDALKE